MRNIDFSSWQSIGLTLFGLVLVTLLGVGIRLVMMVTIQQRRERMNRQINERLRTLIAAYKTLGGSFTGTLTTDPTHLRDLREQGAADAAEGSDRARRIRDAVEAALGDIILLGTEEQVRLASHAAGELAAGRPVRTDALVISLRAFIREALDLAPVPDDLVIPPQGPARPSGSGGKGKDGGRGEGRDKDGGGGGGGMGMGMGIGAGIGGGLGAGGVAALDDEPGHRS